MAFKNKKGRKSSPDKQKPVTQPQQSVLQQFKGLDMNNPGQWPFMPRLAACIVTAVLVVGLAWLLALSATYNRIESERMQELALKDEFSKKIQQVGQLARLQEYKDQVTEYVESLERQLPDNAQMDVLLSNISKASGANRLVLEVLESQPRILRDYYVEQPIAIVVSGKRYEDFATFAQALAGLDRIVTLDDVTLMPVDPEKGEAAGLRLQGTLRTYRYMSPDEQDAVRTSNNNQGS